jgi:hypothetical protein
MKEILLRISRGGGGGGHGGGGLDFPCSRACLVLANEDGFLENL